jgi:Tol biopolymer transport system component
MATYKFGEFLLDPRSRVLLRNGKPIVVSGKAWDTLEMLVQNQGRVLSKDELLTRLWPGTVVEEANLTQAVFTLRKLLGDNSKSPCYIVTIPSRGYQFVAPVEEMSTSADLRATSQASPSPISRSRKRIARTGAFAAGAALLLTSLWVLTIRRGTVQNLVAKPFTATLGQADMPAISPDGKEIAYQLKSEDGKQQGIYVKLIGTDSELRLTNSAEEDCCPRWSPDGRYIAFLRQGNGSSGYFIVSALGGSARQVLRMQSDNYTRFDCLYSGPEWFRDGKHLAVVQRASAHQVPAAERTPYIVSLDIDTGGQQVLTTPPRGVRGDTRPAFSPDGETLAFIRQVADGESDICLLRDRRLRVLTHGASFSGIAWTPDSKELVADGLVDSRSGLWRIPVKDGIARPITFSAESLGSPSVAQSGNRMAYVSFTGNMNLWRLDIDTDVRTSRPTSATNPIRLISSYGFHGNPAYSSNGRNIVFSSNRSGPLEIWTTDADGHAPTRLTSLGGSLTGSPRWSPDGSAVAFDSRASGNPDIFVVPADGGAARRITTGPAEDVVPSWSRDGKWIYFASDRSGNLQIWKAPAATGELPSAPAVRVTREGGINAVESEDGRYLYFAKGRGKPGVWRRPLNGDINSREESALQSVQFWGLWALAKCGIYYLDLGQAPNSKANLEFFDLEQKRTTKLAQLGEPLNPWNPAIALSPDGQSLLYEQLERPVSNIVLLENFR